MPKAHYLPGTLLKLFVHPVLLWLLGKGAQMAGWSIDDFTLTCIVLVFASSLLFFFSGRTPGRLSRDDWNPLLYKKATVVHRPL